MRPIKLDDGKEYYVVYMHPFQMQSLTVLKEFEGRNWRRIKRELRKLNESYRTMGGKNAERR